MKQPLETPPCLFEIVHGSTVLKIEDDWSGHVLIEKIYEGLRQARRTRDVGQASVSVPAPGSEVENAMIEAAMFLGFAQIKDTGTYQATASQIVALMTAAREQGQQAARTARESQEGVK